MVLALIAALLLPVAPALGDYHAAADRILAAARRDRGAYAKLAYLCDRIGNRLSGSPALDHAIVWAQRAMIADGLTAVRAEPVMVPHWVRGAESAEIVAPVARPIAVLGLGGSPGTPRDGVLAPVVVVRDWDDLERRSSEVAGKIVLFDHAMPPYGPQGTGYPEAAAYRNRGPAGAGKLGARAALVRSVTARSLRTPHTGMTRFRKGETPIPAAAISTEDADLIARLAAGGEVRVRLTMGARRLPDARSANVVGELRGRERPGEIVLLGAHLDSWDVGQGAQDDGAGVAMVMQAAALLARLRLAPRRTIRVVLYTNEENGLAGARAYAGAHAAELGRHVAAIEADNGGFRPVGFSLDTRDSVRAAAHAMLADAARLLAGANAARIVDGGSGADISALGAAGVPLLGYRVDASTYFDYHHSQADTLDKVNPADLELGAGVLAVMAYVLADMPGTLPRSAVAATPPAR